MLVSSISLNTINYAKPQKINNVVQPSFGAFKLKNDIIELRYKTILKKALSNFKNLSISEYKLLSDKEKNAIRAILRTQNYEIYKQETEQHNFAAEAIRQNLDSEYGEGNYTVITIGRSLATISKSLAARIGEDRVKNLPMSEISYFSRFTSVDEYQNYIDRLKRKYNKNDLLDFLSKMQLSREKINNTNHKYIIMDYSISGDSIKSAYALLTQDEILGNKNYNISYSSINELLPPDPISSKVLSCLCCQDYKEYSPIGKCVNLKKSDLDRAMNYLKFYNHQRIKDTQLFIFSLYDSFYNSDKNYTDKNLLINNESYEAKKAKFNRDFFMDFCKLASLYIKYPNNFDLEDLLKMQKGYYISNSNKYYEIFRPKFFEIIKSYQ